MLAWNQPQITGDVLGIREALDRSQHQHRAEGGERTHAGMGHQPLRVFAPRHFLRDALVQFLDPDTELIEQLRQVLTPPRHPFSERNLF